MARFDGSNWIVIHIAVDVEGGGYYNSAYVASEYQYASNNYVYVAFEYVNDYNDRDLMFAKSTDHGETWHRITLIGGGPDFDVYASPSITTAEGYVYVAYIHNTDYFTYGEGDVWLDYSENQLPR